MSERSGNRLACPHCKSADYIGEYVCGWREIGGARAVEGGGFVVDRPFGRVEDADHHAFFCSGPNCNVDTELSFNRMVQLGVDGKPLPAAVKGQETLDVG